LPQIAVAIFVVFLPTKTDNMMNPSNTVSIAYWHVAMPPWGLKYWQFVASLNDRFFRISAKPAADIEIPPTPCCELSKMANDALLCSYRDTGDASFMGEIYKRYAHLVLGTCIKYLKDESLAHDAVSEIFAKLIVKLRTFSPAYFPGWLYKVSQNYCLEILRKDQNRPRMEPFEGVIELESISEPEIPDYVTREIVDRELAAALACLPERQRKSIELFFLRGLSYKQVSEKTGFSMKEVKSYVQNGKRNLRIHLTPAATENGWKKSV
jgi:RNA polymerase sigma-70 factor (ECF subfamily)